MNENKGTETIAPTIPSEEDLESRLTRIETEKTKLAEEKENYRRAYLKEVEKGNETEDARVERIVQEKIAESRLVELAREQDEIIKKALKENKELKLAQLSKNGAPPAVIGGHSESTPVRDTIITPEQMAHFKSLGWDEKKIESYKKNLLKKG